MITTVSKSIVAKSIWISDIHLGSVGTKQTHLYDFLQNIKCQNLYLNGDSIDKWLLENKKDFKTLINKFVQKLIQLKNNGSEVVFLSGNHDTLKDLQFYFPNFKCVDEIVYNTLKEKKYLIFHGDKLDQSVNLRRSFLARLGTHVYEFFLKKSRNTQSSKFTRFLKITTKNFLYFIFRYYSSLHRHLKVNNFDGVICGHSHQPKISKINSKDYLNSGDWIDNCTFLIETEFGDFELLRWELSNS